MKTLVLELANLEMQCLPLETERMGSLPPPIPYLNYSYHVFAFQRLYRWGGGIP